MPQIPLKYPHQAAPQSPLRDNPTDITAPSEPCIVRVATSGGHPYCIYLKDGTKITVGRNQYTEGQAWLVVSEQEKKL